MACCVTRVAAETYTALTRAEVTQLLGLVGVDGESVLPPSGSRQEEEALRAVAAQGTLAWPSGMLLRVDSMADQLAHLTATASAATRQARREAMDRMQAVWEGGDSETDARADAGADADADADPHGGAPHDVNWDHNGDVRLGYGFDAMVPEYGVTVTALSDQLNLIPDEPRLVLDQRCSHRDGDMDLEVVGPGDALEHVTIECAKMMIDLDAPEAGVVTELVMPPVVTQELAENGVPFDAFNTPVARLLPLTVKAYCPSPSQRPTGVRDSSSERDGTPPKRSGGDGATPVVTPIEAAQVIARGSRVVALTGAGASSASGLRTRKELWQTRSREEHVGVWAVPEDGEMEAEAGGPGCKAAGQSVNSKWGPLWEVTHALLRDCGESLEPPLPNAAHVALAQLQQGTGTDAGDFPELLGIITQNVDGLHQAAGSTSVLELHGTLERTVCDACGTEHGPSRSVLLRNHPDHATAAPEPPGTSGCGVSSGTEQHLGWPPRCATPGCGGAVRPDVVLFGELVQASTLQAAAELMMQADVVLVVGTAADGEFPSTTCMCIAVDFDLHRPPLRFACGGFDP